MRAYGPPHGGEQGGETTPAHSGWGDAGHGAPQARPGPTADSERGYGAARVGPTGGAARSPGGTAQAGPTELELDLHQECERLRGLAFAARGYTP